MMTLKIALRNIFRHKARSVITLSTIAFGCVALIFIGGFFEDIFEKLRESYIRAQVGHIQIFKKGFHQYGQTDPFAYVIEDDESVKALVQGMSEVHSVTSRLYFSGLISTGENTISFLAQGLEPENDKDLPLEVTQDLRKYAKMSDAGLPVISSGTGLTRGDTQQVVLGRGLAQTMKAQPGSTVTLLTNTVTGSMNAFDVNVKGIFFTAAEEYDNIFLRLPLKTAQRLLNTQGVGVVVIRLNQTADTNKIYDSLRAVIANKNLDLELKRWEDLSDFYNKTVNLFRRFFLILRFVTGIIVVLGIFNTLNMSVMERISEIGTMMALGVRRSGVMKLFFLEGLVLGIVGGLVGVIAGTLGVALVSAVGIIMPPAPGGTIYWVSAPLIIPSIIVSIFFLAVFSGGISSVYPAYKASRLVITEALRYR